MLGKSFKLRVKTESEIINIFMLFHSRAPRFLNEDEGCRDVLWSFIRIQKLDTNCWEYFCPIAQWQIFFRAVFKRALCYVDVRTVDICQDLHNPFCIQMVSRAHCVAVIRYFSSAVFLYSDELFQMKFASRASHIKSKSFSTAEFRGHAQPLTVPALLFPDFCFIWQFEFE